MANFSSDDELSEQCLSSGVAAHPGDMSARGYLNLIDISTQGPKLAESAESLRTYLFSKGHESAVHWAVERIIQHLPDNDIRHRERLYQLVDQARLFDKEINRDIDGLIQFLKTSSSDDPCSENAVVVETIHKSKGLEYDVVIYVNEDKTSRTETDISPVMNENSQTAWILQPIRKEFMQADPALRQLLEQTTSQRDFGNLCTLYVAMTRAKRSLYMISDLERTYKTSTVHFLKQVLGSESQLIELFPAQNTPLDVQHSMSDVQRSTFDVQRSTFKYPVLWSTGDPNWYESFEPPTPETPKKTRVTTQSFQPIHPRLELTRPSSQESRLISAARYFDIEQASDNFGTQVHNAFEQIEWLEDIPSNIDETVRQTLIQCFKQAEIRALFTRPSIPTIVWRERAFSYVEGNRFVNGIFDRVVVYPDANGAFTRAEIIDFKTDRIHVSRTLEQAVEHHRPQLEAYRQALVNILQMETASIELKLLFTNVPKLVQL